MSTRAYFAGRYVAQEARRAGGMINETRGEHVDTNTSGGVESRHATVRTGNRADAAALELRSLAAGVASGPLTSKYHNEKTDGYDSKKEAKRAAELRLLERAGQIRNLREQMPYLLIPSEKDERGQVIERACFYVADFVFDEAPTWRTVVLDVKGIRTDAYIIKRKLMLFVYGIRIREE